MKNLKLIIIVIAIVVVAIGGYLYFSGSMKNAPSKQPTGTLASTTTGQNPVALGTTTTGSTTPIAGTEIAGLLKNISAIRLDDRILSNPSFLALVDSSITLPQTQVSGRVNPFGRSAALDNSTPSQTVINTAATSNTSISNTSNTNSSTNNTTR